MKIAVTADVHLRSREERPERFNALHDVLEKTRDLSLDALIIAGDLFDKDYQNYSEFEALCREFPGITLHIIPGNHDPGLRGQDIVAENVEVYVTPTVVELGSRRFLFLPYVGEKTMREAIAEVEFDPAEAPWALVGHGDYLGGTREVNPTEPGTYMPLMRADLQHFRPRVVLLGHIHDSPAHDTVHYTGSPCGLDISETGRRSFLILETNTWELTRQAIDTDVLFFSERFTLVPNEDEVARLKTEAQERIHSWGLSDGEGAKVRLRVEAVGFALDRSAISETLDGAFGDFSYYKTDGPNLDQLSVSKDVQLNRIAEEVERSIQELDYEWDHDDPTQEEVLLSALHVIYGEK